MPFPGSILKFLAVTLACLALVSHAATFEEVQRIKSHVGIPRWKVAAQRAKAQLADPPDAATAATWRQLDAQTDPLVGKAPLEQTTASNKPEDLLVNASWLRWRILSENADARYSFAYAQNLSRMRNEEGDFDQEAAIFYFHAKLALTLDGMRCTDRTKAEHLMASYVAQDALQPLVQKIGRMQPEDKSAAILEAISLEEMLGERPVMAWLCPRRDLEPAASAASKPRPAKAAEAPARYLDDADWRKYRSDLLEQLTRSAMQDL
ncbi:hypothetical protein [Rhodoferax sp.]|uniref:hypothetical protein n=1 Tax=Rhodoferax sp. TaxID=50421 RepID=UPI00374D5D6F